MSDPNLATPGFIEWLLGIITILFTLLFGWLNNKTTLAHSKIDKAERRVSRCRQEISEDLSRHMNEAQVKDFVDRTIKPIENKVDAIHTDVKTLLKK